LLRALWQRLGIPEQAVLVEGDNELSIDIDDAQSIDAFLSVVMRTSTAVLREVFPRIEDSVACSAEGTYANELVLPFVRKYRSSSNVSAADRHVSVWTPKATRFHEPGSEWLYVKLYASPAVVDLFLRTELKALIERVSPSTVKMRWFFVRYADPSHHLRLRICGLDGKARELVLSALTAHGPSSRSSVRFWKIELSTYHQEVERYGGLESLAICEDLFAIDSACCVDLVRDHETHGPDQRWAITLLSLRHWLDSFELEPDHRVEFLSLARQASLGSQAPFLRKQLSATYREHRRVVDSIIGKPAGLPPELHRVHDRLTQRTVALAPMMRRLREVDAGGLLQRPLRSVFGLLVHMNVNRLIPTAAPAHEFVMLDFLRASYLSQMRRLV